MAFSPDVFKKAIGSPMKPSKGPMGGGSPDMDMDSLMGDYKAPPAPGTESEGEDMMEGGEGAESPLESALESAGYSATPEQIEKIKEILGDIGGIAPMGGAPAPKAASSKLDKLFK